MTSAKLVSPPTAKEMWGHVSMVDRIALAPFRRIGNAMPKDYRGHVLDQWIKRQHEVEAEVEANLIARGARIVRDGHGVRFTLGAMEARSTMGLQSAIRNWRNRAVLFVETVRAKTAQDKAKGEK